MNAIEAKKYLPEMAESLLQFSADARNLKYSATHREQCRQAVFMLLSDTRTMLNKIEKDHACEK